GAAGAAGAGQADLASLALASGLALQSYRRAHVSACVARALARHETQSVAALARLCRSDPAARATLRRCILVPVTGLFRDPEQFELLEERVLPGLLGPRSGLSAWSAGCSDGSELYSVVLMLRRLGVLGGSRLLGSDLSAGRVELARRGAMVSEAVRREARPVLRWERRDLLREPPPPGAFDLVLCRNVAIYFESAAQRALYAKLAAALRPGGVLMLGICERLLAPGQFGLAAAGPHLYRKNAA
ncbi:MAG: CheR family methyltransferase, partial [Streptosporangiaceae bacterium]